MAEMIEAAKSDLDEVLGLVARTLQITKTQFEKAETSYQAIGEWLSDDERKVAQFNPDIFPQGSLRLDTTVRPMSHTEFDIDLVCLVDINSSETPKAVYELLHDRMKEHGTYEPILEANSRCIRICYEGDFHLDIVPAIPDPDCKPDETCMLIPDREKEEWRPSNPRGYSEWFEDRTPVLQIEKYSTLNEARASIEPLVAPLPADLKKPLRIVVQLLKRWRDVRFMKDMSLAPSSIVLTTLAALLYRGEASPSDAMMTVIDGIWDMSCRGPIHLQNPSNLKESLTDRWHKKPNAYEAFLGGIEELRDKWHKIITNDGMIEYSRELKLLVGDAPVTNAWKDFAEARKTARGNGSLLMEQKTGILRAAPAVAPVISVVSKKPSTVVRNHTFHGE